MILRPCRGTPEPKRSEALRQLLRPRRTPVRARSNRMPALWSIASAGDSQERTAWASTGGEDHLTNSWRSQVGMAISSTVGVSMLSTRSSRTRRRRGRRTDLCDEGISRTQRGCAIRGRSPHSDQNLIHAGHRTLDLFEMKNLSGPRCWSHSSASRWFITGPATTPSSRA